ncbi:MAG TPA: TRCF domain-containing protein, partial [Actinomycetota bacterium]|nr:TRCF domain-containing protein [Actinomycetota bacterium]
YLLYPDAEELTPEARARLSALADHTELGAGFSIAMRDLEIRGAGNLLGGEQSGHIAAVGFDTYARLLAESVAELKGEPVPEEREIRIDLPVRAFLPVEYVGEERLRMDLYRRISAARTHAELDAVRDEVRDRFGDLPAEVETLVEVAGLRIACAERGIDEVSTVRGQVRLRPLDADPARLPDGATYHAATRTLNLAPPAQRLGRNLPAWVRRRLGSVASGGV